MRIGTLTCGLLLFGSIAACSKQAEPFTPGFGEIMTLTQMRHTKLWLAGDASNWPLAAYEIDEMNEGFDDLVKFHPTHKDAELPIPQLVETIIKQPMSQMDEAIHAKDKQRFTEAFDALTEGCNSCHRATKFDFNVVVRPTGNPYANQKFEATP